MCLISISMEYNDQFWIPRRGCHDEGMKEKQLGDNKKRPASDEPTPKHHAAALARAPVASAAARVSVLYLWALRKRHPCELNTPKPKLLCVPTSISSIIQNSFFGFIYFRPTDSGGYRKRPPSVRAYAPTRSSKSHPQAPPPDPRLKPGPAFIASGGRGCNQDAAAIEVFDGRTLRRRKAVRTISS